MAPKPRVIYWFRTDLRLHDSPALAAALELKPECLWPIWCWDPHYVYRARVGPNRWQYLLDCQSDLSASITKLNKTSKLHVLREAPQTLLPKLFAAWSPTHLVFEADSDSYAQERDAAIAEAAKKAGVEVVTRVGRTLYDPEALVRANGGKPTMSITQVQNAGPKTGEIPRPWPAPESLPDPGPMDLDEIEHAAPFSDKKYKPDINAVHRPGADEQYSKLAGPKGDFGVPTFDEIGIAPATGPHRGGETRALAALDELAAVDDGSYMATFEKPKTAPTAFAPQSTTLLSAHLHFGSLGIREFYWRVADIVEEHGPKASKPPASLIGQLLFREMYFGAQAALGARFHQTAGNAQVRFVPWHLRSTLDPKTGLATGEYAVDSEEANGWLRRWKLGITGFPWIDAVMRQLRAEGWIHHLARHAVACFLTRGGCYVDWERGAEVFSEFLIDHEPACNAGNWQWLSCTAFFAQFYRCYSPISFPQKTDKNGDFVRHYVPELKNIPAKYIYEPWKAPIADQKKAGVIVKGDGSESEIDGRPAYPKPMFDFNERRKVCIDGMKNAYDVGLYGNDKKVLEGAWPTSFEDDAEGPTEGKKDGMEEAGTESGMRAMDIDDIESDYGTDADDAEAKGTKRKRQEGATEEKKARKAKK